MPFYSVERDEQGKRIELDPDDLLNVPLFGTVILHFSRIFVGTVSSVTCNVKEVLVKSEIRPVFLFDEYEDIESEAEKEEEEDNRSFPLESFKNFSIFFPESSKSDHSSRMFSLAFRKLSDVRKIKLGPFQRL